MDELNEIKKMVISHLKDKKMNFLIFERFIPFKFQKAVHLNLQIIGFPYVLIICFDPFESLDLANDLVRAFFEKCCCSSQNLLGCWFSLVFWILRSHESNFTKSPYSRVCTSWLVGWSVG